MSKSFALTEQILAPEAARQLGYYPITEDYYSNETWMLQNAADCLARGNIPHTVVWSDRGRQLWRR